MAAMTVLLLYALLLLLSSTGLVAGDWEEEVGVNYAPPTFVGAGNAEDRMAGGPIPNSAAPEPRRRVRPRRRRIRAIP